MQLKAGDVIRYGSGSTALARLSGKTSYGAWYGSQCMGGSTHILTDNIRAVDDEDIRMWKKCAWYRGEALRPAIRPLLRKENGIWVVIRRGQIYERDMLMFLRAERLALEWAEMRNNALFPG